MIILHGPPLSPTGLGYTRAGFTNGLRALGINVTSWSPDSQGGLPPVATMDPSWSLDGHHIVINQPMLMNNTEPWFAAMPFFELPLRPDEQPKLKLWGKKRMLCANPDIQTWIRELNPDATAEQTPLVQLGATPHEFDVTVVPGSIVTVGKAEPRKGTRILLNALSQLGKEAYLAITHPLHTQLEIERLQEHADEGGHTLIPFSPLQDDIFALLQSCHVAVFPACAEGWNMPLTEALAQGCIVVASDIAAHRHQYNILVAGIGQDEADRRMLLVPTNRVPMTHHQRWYPSLHYRNVEWDEPSSEAVAQAITSALDLPIPRPWQTNEFPLSWEKAAESLCQALDYSLDS